MNKNVRSGLSKKQSLAYCLLGLNRREQQVCAWFLWLYILLYIKKGENDNKVTTNLMLLSTQCSWELAGEAACVEEL